MALSWGKTDEQSLSRMADFSQSLISNNIAIFKYEDFCSDTVTEMQKICAHLEIPFDMGFLKFNEVKNVNGDLNFKGGTSRGLRSKQINLPLRKWASKATVQKLEGSEALKRACQTLDYSPNYLDPDIARESNFKHFSEVLRVSLSRITKKIAPSRSEP